MSKHLSCQRGRQAGRYFPVTFPPALRRFSRRSRADDSPLRDATTVHRGVLELLTLDLARVADCRPTTETTEHQSAARVVGLVRQLDPEPFAQPVEGRE